MKGIQSLQKLKILTIELLVISAMAIPAGMYGLLIFGKRTPVPLVYQGRWVEDIRKVGDWWSVGYLELMK